MLTSKGDIMRLLLPKSFDHRLAGKGIFGENVSSQSNFTYLEADFNIVPYLAVYWNSKDHFTSKG